MPEVIGSGKEFDGKEFKARRKKAVDEANAKAAADKK